MEHDETMVAETAEGSGAQHETEAVVEERVEERVEELAEELLIEEISIDGMCGVY